MLKLLYGNLLEMPKSLIVVLFICFISLPLFLTTILSEGLKEHDFLFFFIFISFFFHFYAGILLLKKSKSFFNVFLFSGSVASFSKIIFQPSGLEEWRMYLIGSFFNMAIVIVLFLYMKKSIKVKKYFGI